MVTSSNIKDTEVVVSYIVLVLSANANMFSKLIMLNAYFCVFLSFLYVLKKITLSMFATSSIFQVWSQVYLVDRMIDPY